MPKYARPQDDPDHRDRKQAKLDAKAILERPEHDHWGAGPEPRTAPVNDDPKVKRHGTAKE
jgi:hypothetical protein